MKVFNAILGVFAIFASVYCIWFPGVFFLRSGWIVTMLLCAWGVCALFEILSKKAPKGWNILLSVLAILAGAVAGMFTALHPGISVVLDVSVIIVFITWMLVSGVSSSVAAVTTGRKAGGKKWIWSLILGILTLLGGLYGIFHLVVMAQTLGLLLGVLLMVYGTRLLGSIFE